MGRITSVDAVNNMLWLQMHIVNALNIWGDVVINIILWIFF